MKLVAFHITNFKSILDTGWRELSSDNITGLIGQNESGKSSILEALHSFYTGDLDEDSLRSDGKIPAISCSFEVSDDEIVKTFESYDTPPRFADVIIKENKRRINLTRTWSDDDTREAKILLEQTSLVDVFIDAVSDEPTEAVLEEPIPVLSEAVDTPVALSLATDPAIVPTLAIAPPVASTTTIPTTAPAAPLPAAPKSIILDGGRFIELMMDSLPIFELFQDNTSLLPATIDIVDLKEDNSKVDGIKGAQNFLTITGLSIDDILQGNDRSIERKIRAANKALTKDFQNFWSQFVGKSHKIEIEFALKYHDKKDAAKAGEPYLVFWVKDGEELLHPAQRSQGVQWFLSFFLQLRANALLMRDGLILLIDEPGARLHAKAQEDVLKVFESIKDDLQIVYTTHSPYLIDANTLYRLLAVQRAEDDDDNSETKVLGVHHLGAASEDTLLPIYTLIGVNLQHQRVIKQKNNVILEEASAFYYLKGFKKLLANTTDINFIPSSGVTKTPLLANLFLGWGLEFIVLTDDDEQGKKIRRKIKADLYGGDDTESNKHLLALKDCKGVEDLFTKGNFREFVLKDKTLTYTDDNSTYMNSNKESKVLAAVKFSLAVENKEITATQLTTTTMDNARKVFTEIEALL
jgi:ABC-type cobalamin/Fe3+-siderophores transport system ATPase subunit